MVNIFNKLLWFVLVTFFHKIKVLAKFYSAEPSLAFLKFGLEKYSVFMSFSKFERIKA